MKTHAWHRTLGCWIGFPIFLFELYQVVIGKLPVGQLLLTLGLYYLIALVVTVGYHRLFTHSSYRCARFWHYLFGIVGSMTLNSSPVHWAIVHSNHHRYSDGLRDPHVVSWRYFFRFRDLRGLEVGKSIVSLMRDPLHRFLSDYSFLLFLSMGLVFFIINVDWFLYYFLAPIGLYLFMIGLHTIYAHRQGSPRSYNFMEFVIPLGGEWLHSGHHQSPRDANFVINRWDIDPGGLIIKVIKQS